MGASLGRHEAQRQFRAQDITAALVQLGFHVTADRLARWLDVDGHGRVTLDQAEIMIAAAAHR